MADSIIERKQARWLEVGGLANVATFISIIAIAVGINDKLNTLDARAANNCRAINASIILTLEASRETARARHREPDLDRTIHRFEQISQGC